MALDAVVGKVERVVDGGNLLANLALIDSNTWQTSQEVWKAWQNGALIEGVNTANIGIYRLVDGEAVFDLLGREGNPLVDERFREDAYHGIEKNDFFFPQAGMRDSIMAAITAGAVTVHYSGLRVKTQNCGQTCGYVQVDDNNTSEEKKFFNSVYGTKNPGNGKRVYLLREDVVRTQLKEKKKDDVIALACYFYDDLNFNAVAKIIWYYNSAVRGVRRGNVADD